MTLNKTIFVLTVVFITTLSSFRSFAQANEPPFISPVPKSTFAETLAEQLKTDPLVERFAASRKRQANDPYRPVYHFVSPESTLNDPNGLSYSPRLPFLSMTMRSLSYGCSLTRASWRYSSTESRPSLYAFIPVMMRFERHVIPNS